VETVEVLEGNDLTDMEKRLERADLVVDGISVRAKRRCKRI